MTSKNILYLLVIIITIPSHVFTMEQPPVIQTKNCEFMTFPQIITQLLGAWNYRETTLNVLPIELIVHILESIKQQFESNSQSLLNAAKVGDIDNVLKLLKEPYVFINTKDTEGKTPLIYAVYNAVYNPEKNNSIIEALLNACADPNIQDNDGNTALAIATENGKIDIVKVLINKPYININTKNIKGETPLISAVYAAAYNPEEDNSIIEALLNANADPNVEDNNGNTPVSIATAFGKIDILKMLIAANADVNTRHKLGTPLTIAERFNHLGLVEILLDAKADPNMLENYNTKDTPLLIAAKSNNPDLVEKLLNAKADPNIANVDGDTPLIVAVTKSNLEMVKMLLNNGANVNSQNKELQTALMWAIRINSPAIVDLLLKAEADLNIQDNMGNTALDFARHLKRKEIIKLLDQAKQASQ